MEQIKSNTQMERLHLLSCGYIRKYLATRNINHNHIAQIVAKFLFEDWKFDYCYDYYNNGSTIHGIENDGKTIKCKSNGSCCCFYSMFSIGMKPQSGKYKIKFKINKINNMVDGNIIGIISENTKNDEKIKNNNNEKKSQWFNELYDYIGWSANTDTNDKFLPNGLYCQPDGNNIFRQNNFIYSSNNENYKKRLPSLKTNDTIILQYDSDLSILSFSKDNDNGKLNSYIKNLPKDLIFYWFVGHTYGQLCVTVIGERG